MKKYIFSSILGGVVLASTERVFGTPVTFPIAANAEDDTIATGEIGEIMITTTDEESGDVFVQIWLYVKWRTGGERWSDGQVI